jgi:hypothetical protein
MDEKSLLVSCNCGCSILRFTKYDDGIVIDHYESSFYSHQQPVWTAIRKYLKRIWKAITGRDFWFYDIIMDVEETEKFHKNINEFFSDNGIDLWLQGPESKTNL